MMPSSLLSYYQGNQFNPVPIAVENPDVWQSHLAKRRNLYEKHLGIPLTFLRGRTVLEFGSNSGENALVLANFGANLTLVEPNEQVVPRLKMLFKQFGFDKRIDSLVQESVDSFRSPNSYDVVIAEGFINHLANRTDAVRKILDLVVPGGLAVISFDCRYGHFLEMTRKFIFARACQLAQIDDVHSLGSLELAKQLYLQDFVRLAAFRPFEAWWQDVLLNPFVASKYLWSYQELLPVVEEAGGEFLSSSPKWASMDCFTWYKDVAEKKSRDQALLENWTRVFPFFLTGVRPPNEGFEAATSEVIDSVSHLVAQISEYIADPDSSIDSVLYPLLLHEYFERSKASELRRFNSDLKRLYDAVKSCQLDDLLSAYHGATCIRNLWGAPYHYISVGKLA